MSIDESILSTSLSDMFKESELVCLNMSNFKEHPGLTSFDYCTIQGIEGYHTFLDFNIHKLAFKVDNSKRINEVLLIIRVWDSTDFFEKTVNNYGLPNSSSLSKYYIEKHGFRIPPEIDRDSLLNYYENLPEPQIEEFEELQSLIWYDLKKNSHKTLADMIIKNKTDPSNKYLEKEIWVSFKRAKD
ncbi:MULTISPECIES: hypothetical protein [Flavobacteriaceae]|uniref:hypothetical protein n=1 Tax=Flavobacteriaceae TaxID=49546 RepID=UPI001492179B|nr:MULTISPECIES: hypothetical protein [Allomuricauda]MDC6366453.1 hypothetical protein [Muricauda sp. AC10]